MKVGLEAVRLGLALVAVLGAGTVGGCGSSTSDGGGGGGTGNGGPYVPPAGSYAVPMCETNQPCRCANTLIGTTTCEGNVEACDCSACEMPEVVLPAFEACGGEPFGQWQLVGTEAHFDFAPQSADCSALGKETIPLRMVLDLQDGGEARLLASGGNYDVQVRSACLGNDTCETRGCTVDSCGYCVCGRGVLQVNGDSLSWSREGSSLAVTYTGSEVASFDFCVKGDALELRLSDQKTVLKLERVELVGRPIPCARRSAETCAPTDEPDECHVGGCTGTGQTCGEATTQAECSTKQGCAWDTTLCRGQPYPYCRISDYGVLPGCDATAPAPT